MTERYHTYILVGYAQAIRDYERRTGLRENGVRIVHATPGTRGLEGRRLNGVRVVLLPGATTTLIWTLRRVAALDGLSSEEVFDLSEVRFP